MGYKKQLSEKYNLQISNPILSQEWHPTKNGSLNPKSVSPGSGRKVWWRCKKRHEWIASIDNRGKGRGCPYCRNKRVNDENSLLVTNPSLAKEWHQTKNGALTPSDVVPGSHRKVWWRCGKGHEWKAIIGHRNKGSNCIYCTNQAVNRENCLATRNPTLAQEWHPTKNKPLTPFDILPGTAKKAWWKCKRGHEWKASIGARNSGIGCPSCHSQTSQMELRIFSEIKCLFENVSLRKKIKGIECDVFIPDYQLGIEYDGHYWHKNKLTSDMDKNKRLKKLGIALIRVREINLPKISDYDVIHSRREKGYSLMKKILHAIMSLKKLEPKDMSRVAQYLGQGEYANNKEYLAFAHRLSSPLPGTSLFDLNISLAKEWHPQKNHPLTPKDVTVSSERKVWWICKKGHEWEADIGHRNIGTGCPYCSSKMISKDNCLNYINPTLSSEWHPTKNGTLTAKDVTPGTNKKVWWLCDKGHEWFASIANRSKGRNCPYCSKYSSFITEANCLEAKNPKLAKQWHPTKNSLLTARDITSASAKKVWWLCDKGHEWFASIANRSKGRNCPYCSGKKTNSDNCLQTVNPPLASEWHPTKNGTLTPKDVTAGSDKNVWWLCKEGHEWQANIYNRKNGTNCPLCNKHTKKRAEKRAR